MATPCSTLHLDDVFKSSQRSAKQPGMSTAVFSPSAEPDDTNQLGSWLFALSLMALRQRLRDHGMKLRDKCPDGQAALRRSATMAGVSTSGSRAHSFHQGRGAGSTGGWWERCWPSSTTNGPRPAATSPFPTPTATMRYPPLISWKQRPDQRQRGRRAFTPIDGTLPTLRLLAAGVSRKSRCKPPGPLPYSNTGALPVS